MAPVGLKGKSKGREHRRSGSRNTTPSSVSVSTVAGPNAAATTAFLEMPLLQLLVSTDITYDDILERHGATSGIPDPKHLDSLAADLRALAQLAETRGQVCDRGMRELSKKRKERLEYDREKEREDRELEERQEQLKREAAAKAEERAAKERKAAKAKKGKDSNRVRDERPPTHGAHGLARQDGLDTEMKDATPSPEPVKPSTELERSPVDIKREIASTSISSLSPSSHAPSPVTLPANDLKAASASPASSKSSMDRQPEPAPAVTQYQMFGPDPLTFDDPTIYHIREVTPGMSEEEIKEIYSVSHYPHDDLHDLVPSTPPDRDLSNAKPPNQVSANTFTTYVEPYFRPLTEEDLAFLRERGDRVQPFIIPRRGKRHYTEVWAEEEGALSTEPMHQGTKRLPPNQARGGIEQITDEVTETETISTGPLLSRLLAAMRPEARPLPTEDKPPGENAPSADIVMGGMNGEVNGDNPVNGDAEKPVSLPPATFIPDSTQPGWKIPTTKLDYAQIDERLKQELRYLGFLGEESEPDYDAHYDDELAARMRYLQAELKDQSILNGARKTRVADLAKERLAHQEYATILEDLDTQVQQAYVKRTRTLSKGKKQQKRPGGAGGGSHYVGGAAGAGVSRPAIGDVVKTLMERRKKWIDSIGPVFEEGLTQIPRDTIFGASSMPGLVGRERDGWDEGDD